MRYLVTTRVFVEADSLGEAAQEVTAILNPEFKLYEVLASPAPLQGKEKENGTRDNS